MAGSQKFRVRFPGDPPTMTRDFDRKEIERQEYLQDHSSTKFLKEEIKELKKENSNLKKKVKALSKQIKKN